MLPCSHGKHHPEEYVLTLEDRDKYMARCRANRTPIRKEAVEPELESESVDHLNRFGEEDEFTSGLIDFRRPNRKK